MEEATEKALLALPMYTALISAGSGLLGVIIGAIGNYFLQRLTVKTAARGEYRKDALPALQNAYHETSRLKKQMFVAINELTNARDQDRQPLLNVALQKYRKKSEVSMRFAVLLYAPQLQEQMDEFSNSFVELAKTVTAAEDAFNHEDGPAELIGLATVSYDSFTALCHGLQKSLIEASRATYEIH